MGCFGGGNEVKQESTATKGQRKLLNSLTDYLTPQVGQGVPGYQGQTVADTSQLQQNAFDLAGNIGGFVNNASNFNNSQGQSFLNNAQGNLNAATADFDPTATKDYFKTNIANPAMQNWNENMIPQIMERFAGNNAADSGMAQRQVAKSGSDLNSSLSQQLSQMLYQGQNDALGRKMQGAQLGGQLASMPGDMAMQNMQLGQGAANLTGQMYDIGAMQRGLGQEQLTAEQQKWAQSQPWSNPNLGAFLAPALGTTQIENVGFPASSGIVPSLIGAAGMLGMGYMMRPAAGAAGAGGGAALSDERCKTDIEHIDNALEKVMKIDGKTFKYIGHADHEAGLIAQEIEKVLPEAVTEVDGVKMVKYNAVIGLLVNAIKELAERN